MAASKTLTKQQRIDRARKAGKASQNLNSYVQRVVDHAPELSAAQRDRLAAILRPNGDGAS